MAVRVPNVLDWRLIVWHDKRSYSSGSSDLRLECKALDVVSKLPRCFDVWVVSKFADWLVAARKLARTDD
jgi:hypothetical protein